MPLSLVEAFQLEGPKSCLASASELERMMHAALEAVMLRPQVGERADTRVELEVAVLRVLAVALQALFYVGVVAMMDVLLCGCL